MEEPQIDPELGQADPQGQPPEEGQGNDPGGATGDEPTNDFIEFEGAKIPREAFEKTARERFKDQFDAYENKSKWQAENTKKAQEYAELKRKAEYADRLMADPRLNTKSDPYQSAKEKFTQKILSKWPDTNREFLEMLFEGQSELAGLKAQDSISPIQEYQLKEWEKSFMSQHPDVKPGTKEFDKLYELIERNVDPEDAYALAYRDSLINKKIEEAIKTRDEDAKRKLKSSKTSSVTSKASSHLEGDAAFKDAWAKFGD